MLVIKALLVTREETQLKTKSNLWAKRNGFLFLAEQILNLFFISCWRALWDL